MLLPNGWDENPLHSPPNGPPPGRGETILDQSFLSNEPTELVKNSIYSGTPILQSLN